MRSVKALRTAKIGYIIISAILCALGILLIAKPDMSLSLIGIIVGIVLIVFGVIKLIGYFPRTCTGWPFNSTWPSAFC